MTIKIWNRRYHDNKALLAEYKVKDGENTIEFTKEKSLKGKKFTMTGAEIRSYPLESNGKIMCHAVPMDVLTGGQNES